MARCRVRPLSRPFVCMSPSDYSSRIAPAGFNPSHQAPDLAVSRLYDGAINRFRHLWMRWVFESSSPMQGCSPHKAGKGWLAMLAVN